MYTRKVQITLHEEFHELLAHEPMAENTLGYLAMWAIYGDRHVSVAILGDRNGDLHATYLDKDSNISYQIFAQRDDLGGYTFHS